MSRVLKAHKSTVRLPGAEVLDQWCDSIVPVCCQKSNSACLPFPDRLMVVLRDFAAPAVCYTGLTVEPAPVSLGITSGAPCSPPASSTVGTMSPIGFDNGTYRLSRTFQNDTEAWYVLTDSKDVAPNGLITFATRTRQVIHYTTFMPPPDFITTGAAGSTCITTLTPSYIYSPSTASPIASPTPDCVPVLPTACTSYSDGPDAYKPFWMCNATVANALCINNTLVASVAPCPVHIGCDVEWLNGGISGPPVFVTETILNRWNALTTDCVQCHDPWSGTFKKLVQGGEVGDVVNKKFTVSFESPKTWIQIFVKIKCSETGGGSGHALFITDLWFRTYVTGGFSSNVSDNATQSTDHGNYIDTETVSYSYRATGIKTAMIFDNGYDPTGLPGTVDGSLPVHPFNDYYELFSNGNGFVEVIGE